VVRVVAAGPQPVRRSRGHVPRPVRLTSSVPPLMAVGGEIKATAAVASGEHAWLTQHLGDVENLQTLAMLGRSLALLADVQRVVPQAVVSDAHPGYLSRRWAAEQAAARGVPHLTVQHHHAHLSSLLAEHGLDGDRPVLGMVFDGTGYGTDGTIWGGELLLGGYDEVRRVGHLRPVQLPGGDAAIGYPWRTALAHLDAAGIDAAGSPPERAAPPGQTALLQQMLHSGSHCTPTTSVGRLFDAVASLLDVRHTVDYEAQAAIELEALARPAPPWPVEVGWEADRVVIDPAGWLRLAVSATDAAQASYAFHAGVAGAVVEAARLVRQRHDVAAVGLTGGVFGNVLLTEMAAKSLTAAGFEVLLHRVVPPNDGGLALGQVCVAGAAIAKGRAHDDERLG
jgi:hydrogenase maturation protein HypF